MTRKFVKRWSGIVAGATLILLVGSMYQPTVVVGQSMEPSLKPGSMIWVDRTYYLNHRPQRGEVIVFRRNGVTYVKRVYRAPGESLYYLANGSDWLGTIRESRVSAARDITTGLRMDYKVRKLDVPEDSVFVLGDNLLVSEDSRDLGPISIREIVGRAHLQPDATTALPYELAPRGRHKRVDNHPAAPAGV